MCAQPTIEVPSGLFEDEFTNPQPLESPNLPVRTPTVLSATVDSFPADLKAQALHRLDYIRWIEEHLEGGWTEKNLVPLLVEAAQALPPPAPNWRTLARWQKIYNHHGRKLTALIPKHQYKGNVRSRLPSSDEVFFEQAVHCFLVGEQPSIASAYQRYTNAIPKGLTR